MKTITLKSGKEISLNQAFNCDCLEFMPELPDKCIDMILCDLPYGTTACKWDVIIPFEPLWEQYKRIIKDDGAIVLTASQPFTTDVIMSNREWFKYCWVWDKVSGANIFNLKNRPLKTHEDIIIFSNSSNFTFNPIKILRTEKSLKRDPIKDKGRTIRRKTEATMRHYDAKNLEEHIISNDGMKHPVDIIKFPIKEYNNSGVTHPTKKPTKLFEYLIRTYTKQNDLVFDNCLGSFTTGVASYNTGRNWIGTEMDKQIFTDGSLRYEQETKQMLMNF